MLKLTYVKVTTEPTLLITSDANGSEIKIGNASGSVVMLGDADVTTENGLQLLNNSIETFSVQPLTSIFGIIAKESVAVTILEF